MFLLRGNQHVPRHQDDYNEVICVRNRCPLGDEGPVAVPYPKGIFRRCRPGAIFVKGVAHLRIVRRTTTTSWGRRMATVFSLG